MNEHAPQPVTEAMHPAQQDLALLHEGQGQLFSDDALKDPRTVEAEAQATREAMLSRVATFANSADRQHAAGADIRKNTGLSHDDVMKLGYGTYAELEKDAVSWQEAKNVETARDARQQELKDKHEAWRADLEGHRASKRQAVKEAEDEVDQAYASAINDRASQVHQGMLLKKSGAKTDQATSEKLYQEAVTQAAAEIKREDHVPAPAKPEGFKVPTNKAAEERQTELSKLLREHNRALLTRQPKATTASQPAKSVEQNQATKATETPAVSTRPLASKNSDPTSIDMSTTPVVITTLGAKPEASETETATLLGEEPVIVPEVSMDEVRTNNENEEIVSPVEPADEAADIDDVAEARGDDSAEEDGVDDDADAETAEQDDPVQGGLTEKERATLRKRKLPRLSIRRALKAGVQRVRDAGNYLPENYGEDDYVREGAGSLIKNFGKPHPESLVAGARGQAEYNAFQTEKQGYEAALRKGEDLDFRKIGDETSGRLRKREYEKRIRGMVKDHMTSWNPEGIEFDAEDYAPTYGVKGREAIISQLEAERERRAKGGRRARVGRRLEPMSDEEFYNRLDELLAEDEGVRYRAPEREDRTEAENASTEPTYTNEWSEPQVYGRPAAVPKLDDGVSGRTVYTVNGQSTTVKPAGAGERMSLAQRENLSDDELADLRAQGQAIARRAEADASNQPVRRQKAAARIGSLVRSTTRNRRNRRPNDDASSESE